MQSGDGWLVRIKPRLSRISAQEGELIADRALACGNGIIELTARGNLQLRGLTPASAAQLADVAVAAGLACSEPSAERRRNILLSPMAGEPACRVARDLEARLIADTALTALPGKFGFAVDDGEALGLGGAGADIVLRVAGGAWQVGAGDGAAARRRSPDAAAEAAIALAHDWLTGDWLTGGVPSRRSNGVQSEGAGKVAVGWLPAHRAFGVGVPFGQTDAATLRRICAVSRRFGDGVLHVTPWRVILLSGIRAPDLPALHKAAAGLIVSPDDPRLLVSACIGRAGCLSGSVDARKDALTLLAAGLEAASLHVSGCAKGCAHPGRAAVTLVGDGGRYGLVRDGRAGDTPQIDGLTVARVADHLRSQQRRGRVNRS